MMISVSFVKFFGLSSFEQGYQLLKLIARMAIEFLAAISITASYYFRFWAVV